jgi:hypothetical protein
MAAKPLRSRASARRWRDNLLADGIRHLDGRRPGVLLRAGLPRGTPDDLLVQKVLERMTIDETRRVAF